MQLVCPHCAALNRIPDSKPALQANCGKCHKPLFTGTPLAVNRQQFERHIHKNDIPLVVDYWASWCGPCKMMAPVFAQAAQKIEPRARLLKVDTEAEQAIAAQYGIRSIPTLMVFSGGRETGRIAGAMDLSNLLGWINQQI